MRNLTESNITQAVLQKLEGAQDERLKQVMTSLVKHLHAFVREVELTEEEWLRGIRFLSEAGAITDDKRNEFILLSDTLAVSMLVDAMAHRAPQGATESSVLGPFYREGAPELPLGASIAGDTPGEPTVVRGRVTGPDGAPIPGAVLDVWQTAPNGLYETQDPGQPDMNLRGRFRADAEGCFQFRTVRPVSYPIPVDGPVGKLLSALGRHPFRPAHIHFIVSAEGFEPVTTQLFVEGDEYLESDAVFGVKNSLVVEFGRQDSAKEAERLGVKAPFYMVQYDFGLKSAV